MISSLIFGTSGSYCIGGINITFENTSNREFPTLDGAGTISSLAEKCLKSTAFRLLTLSYVHVFVHEMSHALAYRLFESGNPSIHINTGTQDFGGWCSYPSPIVSKWGRICVSMAGSMGNIAFSTCQIVSSIALSHLISPPISAILAGGAAIWICGELLYSYVSGLKQDNGDFGQIAKMGPNCLMLAAAALVSECALALILISRV